MMPRQIGVRKQTVDLQKHQAGSQCRPFVAIDEGMIATQIKKIGSGDFLRIGNQWCATGGRLGRRNSRLQQCAVTQSCTATMRAQHLAVYGKDCCNIQMNQYRFRQGA